MQAADLHAARPGSVQRAFLEYWSALENEEWSVAVQYYPEVTRHRLGYALLIAALRLEGADSDTIVKPLIRSVHAARGDQTSIRYLLRRSDGTIRATSTTWRRQSGRWTIAYSASLDNSYSTAVQQMVQDHVAPDGATAAPEAIRAGRRALRAQAYALGRP